MQIIIGVNNILPCLSDQDTSHWFSGSWLNNNSSRLCTCMTDECRHWWFTWNYSIIRLCIIQLLVNIFYPEICVLVLLDKHHKVNNTMLHRNHSLIHDLLLIHRLHETEFEPVYEQHNSSREHSIDNNQDSLYNHRLVWSFFQSFLRTNMAYNNNRNSM